MHNYVEDNNAPSHPLARNVSGLTDEGKPISSTLGTAIFTGACFVCGDCALRSAKNPDIVAIVQTFESPYTIHCIWMATGKANG